MSVGNTDEQTDEFLNWCDSLTTRDYFDGLSAMIDRATPGQRSRLHQLLPAQYFAPGRAVTAGQLAKLAEIPGGMPTVNLMYGRLGRLFCESDVPANNAEIEEADHRWWHVWSKGKTSAAGFLWTMRSQVAEAMELLGWVSPSETRLPDEVVVTKKYVEGSVRRVIVNAYERDRAARQTCIDHFGAVCVVCGFSFGKAYGVDVADFIHVHHLRLLSEIAEEYEVDPIADLRPVCPNCHAMIHHGGENRSIEAVRNMFNPKLRDFLTILNSDS